MTDTTAIVAETDYVRVTILSMDRGTITVQAVVLVITGERSWINGIQRMEKPRNVVSKRLV